MAKQHEEYKGYIITPGITMPAQGIYDYDVFESMRDFEADYSPVTSESSRDAAIAWVDRVTGTVTRVGATWWSEYDYTESPAPFISPTARQAVERMPQQEQDIFRMTAALVDFEGSELKDKVNEVLSKISALGITPPELSDKEKQDVGTAQGNIEREMLKHAMSEEEYERFKADIT